MDTTVIRNDKITPWDALDMSPEAIVISQVYFNEAGIYLDLVKASAEAEKPVYALASVWGINPSGRLLVVTLSPV